MPTKTFIAALDQDNGATPDAFCALRDLLGFLDPVEILSDANNVIVFSGPQTVVDKLKEQFAGRLLIEPNQTLSLDDPAPNIPTDTGGTDSLRPSSQDGDDKDPDEIVIF